MGMFVVSIPGLSQSFLAAKIPHLKFDIFVLDLFNVWTNRWLSEDNFS